MSRTGGGSGEKFVVRADAVVSTAGVRNTFLNLLPREVASKTEIYKKVRLFKLTVRIESGKWDTKQMLLL